MAGRRSPPWCSARRGSASSATGTSSTRHELWWQFLLEGDAPRFLRATAGVMIATALFGALQLVRLRRHRSPSGRRSRSRRDGAGGGCHRHRRARRPPSAGLALLGDKRFLFSDSGRSFVMYGVQGRSWVAMGEPIGLARPSGSSCCGAFASAATCGAAAPCSTRSAPRSCPTWSSSASPSTSSASRPSCRWPGSASTARPASGCARPSRRAERDGAVFAVVPAEGVPALMPELRAISDAWLASKSAREKGLLARAASIRATSRAFRSPSVRKGRARGLRQSVGRRPTGASCRST